MTNKKLSNQEMQVLRLLSFGSSYAEIAEKLGMQLASLYTVADHIRKKTGVATRDSQSCREYFRAEKRNPRLPPLAVTPKQLEVLRLVAQGMRYPEIAKRLSLGQQTAQNHASLGCKRAHIAGGRNRLESLRFYLLKNGLELSPMADPMF